MRRDKIAGVASGLLTGSALREYINNRKDAHGNLIQITQWDSFKDLMRQSYGQHFEEHTVRNKIEALKQTTSVDAYTRAFKNLVAMLVESPMAEIDKVRAYYRGLKPSLQASCNHDPSGAGPFVSLERISQYAASLEISNSLRQQDNHQRYDKQAERHVDRSRRFHTSNNNNNNHNNNYNNNKRKISFSEHSKDNNDYKKGKASGSKPPSTFYTQESGEYAYAAETGICLYCAKKGHHSKECQDKLNGRPPTRIRISPNWKPGRSNRQDSDAPATPSPIAVVASAIIGVEMKALEELTNRAFTAVPPNSDKTGFQKLLQDNTHILVFEEEIQVVTEYLEVYRHVKEHKPSLSAIFIVPTSLGGWRSKLKDMKLLKRFSKGDAILLTKGETHEALRQNMQAFYDASQLPDTLRMLVKGLINGAEGKILLDTGASRSAISAATASKLGLPVSSQPAF